MKAKQTQIQSYKEIREDGSLGKQQRRVLEGYKRCAPCSRRFLAQRLDGLMYTDVCGRTRELLDKNRLEIVGVSPNEDTGRQAELLEVSN